MRIIIERGYFTGSYSIRKIYAKCQSARSHASPISQNEVYKKVESCLKRIYLAHSDNMFSSLSNHIPATGYKINLYPCMSTSALHISIYIDFPPCPLQRAFEYPQPRFQKKEPNPPCVVSPSPFLRASINRTHKRCGYRLSSEAGYSGL